MKGSSVSLITLVEALMTALIIFTSGATLTKGFSDEVKEKMVDVQADRIKNAGLALSQIPNGSISVEMDGYSIKYDEADKMINVTFRDTHGGTKFDYANFNYDCVDAPSNSEKIEGEVCISRNPSTTNGCGTSRTTDYEFEIDPSGC